MTPFELLAQLQAQIPLWQESKRALEEREHAQLKDLQAGGRSLPSELQWYVNSFKRISEEVNNDPIPPTQSVGDYVMLKETKRILDDTIRDRTTFTASDKIVLGSIESMRIDAGIYGVNDVPEFLIVLNRGVLEAISTITNLIAYVADLDEDRLWIRGVLTEKVEEVRQRFIDIICKYVLNLSPENYAKIPIARGSPREVLWVLLHQETEMFVVGHEYGHFLCGHFAKQQPVSGPDGVPTRETMLFQWAQEYEADIAGYDLCVLTGQRLCRDNVAGIEEGWRGVNVFFDIVHLFNRVFDIDRRMIPQSTHPSPSLRINNLFQYTDKKLQHPDFMRRLMDMRYGLTNCLAALWHQCEDGVKEIVAANAEALSSRRRELLGNEEAR